MTSIDNVVVQGGSVGYKMNEPLLSDVHFSFSPGEIIAINGASGIGKTTLLKTLQRHLFPHNFPVYAMTGFGFDW